MRAVRVVGRTKDACFVFLDGRWNAAIMYYAPQAKPQLNPFGAETFAIKGAPGVLPPKGLRWGDAGIHMLAQRFMPSAKAAHGFMLAQGLKFPLRNGENDIGSCAW